VILEYLASEGGLSLLDVNPGLVIWTTVTFLVVFAVLKIFAWKPITTALDSRAEKVHADIERAEAVKKDAEKRLEEYIAKLDGLKEEGYSILTESKRDAERLRDEILSSAKKEADAIKERGLRDVKLAVDQALDQIHREIANLSVEIAGKILGKTLTAKDHQELISDSISKLKSLN
jgi:F-type H+-transporting ATPase subunit b